MALSKSNKYLVMGIYSLFKIRKTLAWSLEGLEEASLLRQRPPLYDGMDLYTETECCDIYFCRVFFFLICSLGPYPE